MKTLRIAVLASLLMMLSACNQNTKKKSNKEVAQSNAVNAKPIKSTIVYGYKVGDIATDFSLKNIDDTMVSLSDFPEAKGFIVTFTCNHCPYSVAYEDRIIRVEFFGDEIDAIRYVDPVTGATLQSMEALNIYPARHFVTPDDKLEAACQGIRAELKEQLAFLEENGKLLEAQRLEQRTRYDLEMLEEVGYCNGVENYTRHLAGRLPGAPPECLLDYFPHDDWLLAVDESHVTVPQLRAMYNGDQARKRVLIDHGFRLPSAADNRPLKSEEFWDKVKIGRASCRERV